MANMRAGDVSDSQLLNCLLIYLNNSRTLQPVVTQFRSMPLGSSDYTYRELRSRWLRHVQIGREDRNRAALQQGMIAGDPALSNVAACRNWAQRGHCKYLSRGICHFGHPEDQRGPPRSPSPSAVAEGLPSS